MPADLEPLGEGPSIEEARLRLVAAARNLSHAEILPVGDPERERWIRSAEDLARAAIEYLPF